MRARGASRGLVAAATLAMSGCAAGGGHAKGAPVVVVDVVRAARQNLATSITLDGQIAPLLSSTLSSPQSGNVVAVYVNEGDRAHRGQLLAKLDDASLRAQLVQAQGQVLAAHGKLQGSVITQPIQSTQYGSTWDQAVSRVRSDRAALTNAKLVYDSNVKLYPQGYIAQTVLEQSRATYVAAQQQERQDEAALGAARASLGQTQADIQNVESNRGALEQAGGLVQQLRTEIEQTSIVAPFDGIVTARLLDPGSFAGPNQPVLTVSHLDTVYLNANVPDDALAYVRAGKPITFTTTSLPGKTFHATIADINATPTQGTLLYRARIRYPNAGGALRGGMLVSVIAGKEKRENAVVVPRTSIVQAENGDAVFVAKDGQAVRVPVRVGMQTDTLAEVRGLEPGAEVITTHPDSLQPGSKVAIDGAQGAR